MRSGAMGRSLPGRSGARRTQPATGRRGSVETLEARTLLAASLSGGVLTVTGDDAGFTSDTFLLRRVSLFSNAIEVVVNGTTQFSGSLTGINSIVVDGRRLDDLLQVVFQNGNPIPAGGLTFFGGNEDDTLRLESSGFTGNSITFNGGTNFFGISDRDTIIATASGGVDLTLDNSRLANPAAGGTVVNLSSVSDAELNGGTGDNTFDARGFSGSTDMEGFDGNDRLLGGSGVDALNGGPGNDDLFGFGSGDVLLGFGGNDDLSGGDGVDLVAGMDGDDAVDGGDGDDFSVDGGPGIDLVSGGLGNDNLFGGDGNDQVSGGDGNDVIEGGEGNDTLTGGEDNDTYVFDPAAVDQVDRVVELVNGGVDTLDFSGLAATDPVVVNLGTTVNTATHTRRRVNAFATGATRTFVENVIGGAGADQVGGESLAANHLVGGPGNDRLVGGTDNNANGSVDTDTLEGGTGNDTLLGGSGSDTVLGQEGDDTLDGGDNDDVQNGGPGNDFIFATRGIDTVVIEGTAAGEFITVTSPQANRLLAVRRLVAGGPVVESDEISTAVVRLNVLALGGNDTVDLTAVPTAIIASTLVDGGTGGDTLLGSNDDDDLRGGAGSDGDRLEGNGGADTLDGGGGVDTIVGGDGNDTLVDNDNVVDDVNLGAGEDGILVSGTAGDDVIHVGWQPGPQAVITVNGVVSITSYREGETIFVFAGAGDDRVSMSDEAGLRWKADFHGEAGNDWLTGNSNDDTLDGGTGNDLLDGAAGDDVLRGGPGFDLLLGGEGDDDLDGGTGFDLLIQDAVPSHFPRGAVKLLHAESAAILRALDDHERRRGRLPGT